MRSREEVQLARRLRFEPLERSLHELFLELTRGADVEARAARLAEAATR